MALASWRHSALSAEKKKSSLGEDKQKFSEPTSPQASLLSTFSVPNTDILQYNLRSVNPAINSLLISSHLIIRAIIWGLFRLFWRIHWIFLSKHFPGLLSSFTKCLVYLLTPWLSSLTTYLVRPDQVTGCRHKLKNYVKMTGQGIKIQERRQTRQYWVTVTFTIDMQFNVFLLSFMHMRGQHFYLGEYEYIKRKSLQLLVLPIVERHCLHTLSLHLFENVLHFKNQTFSSLSSLNSTHFPAVSRLFEALAEGQNQIHPNEKAIVDLFLHLVPPYSFSPRKHLSFFVVPGAYENIRAHLSPEENSPALSKAVLFSTRPWQSVFLKAFGRL